MIPHQPANSGKVVARKGMWLYRQKRGKLHSRSDQRAGPQEETEKLKRRDFVLRSAACLTATPTLPTPGLSGPLRPLRADQTQRGLLVRHEADGRCLILSDAPDTPRDLIRPEVIERVFGPGVYDTLSQPDHWRMIDAGWFGGADLFTPVPLGDLAYLAWCSWHRPENDAHDLLLHLFSDRVLGRLGVYLPECGLTLAEHPCTPRYATARVEHAGFLPELAKQVATRTDFLHCCFGPPSSSAASCDFHSV